MIIVSNSSGYSQKYSCYEEVLDYFGKEDFDAMMNGYHTELSISHEMSDESLQES